MFEIIHEPEEPVLSPEEARIQRAAELGDELIRLEKRKARQRISRTIGPGFMVLVTVAVAWELRDPVFVSVLIGALVGILGLYRWEAARLDDKQFRIEEEFDGLTRALPASPPLAEAGQQENGE